MNSSKSTPRAQQQQPLRENDPQQQSGSREFQPNANTERRPQGGGQQMGEGSYEATRDYQKDIQDYLKDADVQSDAEKARPRSEQEARELEEAEKEGRSHSKGER